MRETTGAEATVVCTPHDSPYQGGAFGGERSLWLIRGISGCGDCAWRRRTDGSGHR